MLSKSKVSEGIAEHPAMKPHHLQLGRIQGFSSANRTGTAVLGSTSWILPLLLLLLSFPAALHAQFVYTTNNSTITITRYTGSGGAVTIPGTLNGLPVAAVGDAAFNGCTNVTSVTIPDSVTNIADFAFRICYGLTDVTVGTNVASIGYGAFYLCTNLTSITLPDSVITVWDEAFEICSSLTNVTMGNGVTNLGIYAFSRCPSLVHVTLSTNLTTINYRAFEQCTSLTSVTIPNSVSFIKVAAFNECTSLTNVFIPNSVTNIAATAFTYCTSLTAFTVDPLNPVYSSEDGVLFDKSRTILIQCPARAGGYTTPGNVTSIGTSAFFYCISLTSLTIGDSVTNIGGGAFGYCTNLTTVMIGTNVASIGNYAFNICTSLTNVYFLGNAPSFGGGAFGFPNWAPGLDPATIYYLPGTTGWENVATNTGIATVLWLPRIQTSDSSFGVRDSQFGFNITWANGMTVVVEAGADLANPIWSPVATNTLTGGLAYFSDPQWTNYPRRFYRLRWP